MWNVPYRLLNLFPEETLFRWSCNDSAKWVAKFFVLFDLYKKKNPNERIYKTRLICRWKIHQKLNPRQTRADENQCSTAYEGSVFMRVYFCVNKYICGCVRAHVAVCTDMYLSMCLFLHVVCVRVLVKMYLCSYGFFMWMCTIDAHILTAQHPRICIFAIFINKNKKIKQFYNIYFLFLFWEGANRHFSCKTLIGGIFFQSYYF